MVDSTTVASWPKWQRAFAAGSLVLWPCDEVRDKVNALRARLDPASLAICEAHVTLTQPFLEAPDSQAWERIEAVLGAFEPFHLTYGPVRSFLPETVLWLDLQPAQHVLKLRQALHETGLFDLSRPHTEGFIPHMTLTEGRSGPLVNEALWISLALEGHKGSFPCDRITHLVPDAGFCFGVKRHLPIGVPRA